MKYAPNAAITTSTEAAGLSVQRQASRLSSAALPAATMSANAMAKPQPRRLPWPGNCATSRHSGTLQAVASQVLMSTTTQAGCRWRVAVETGRGAVPVARWGSSRRCSIKGMGRTVAPEA